MRNLLLISSILFLISCQNHPYRSFSVIKSLELVNGVIPFVFSDLSNSKLYKTKVDIEVLGKEHYLSGLLIFKKIDNSHRVVFTSEMGMKFFDFEFAPDTFIVHHVMEKFDNKYVLKTLEEDIGALLMYKAFPNTYLELGSEQEKQQVFQYKEGDESLYYWVDIEKQKTVKIEKVGKKKSKMIILINDYVEDTPQLVQLKHSDFKMNIELNYINRD